MERRKYYYLLGCAIAFTSCLFSGCMEYADDPSGFTKERIVINFTDSITDASVTSESRTRSVSESTNIGSGVLTSKSGKKMYFNCTESPWPSKKHTATRGTKVTTAGISNLGVSASVYSANLSYTSAGCGSYFYKEAVSPGTPMSYYWPTSDYKMSFYAYYPYNNAAFTVASAANVGGIPRYYYTVPSAIADQQDIMTGMILNHLGGSSSPLNITLTHNCSAIHFSVTNNRAETITVNSISIEGVKYRGYLRANTWTLENYINGSSLNPFTLTSNVSVAAGTTVDITGMSNVFMMLPQNFISVAKLKVVVGNEEFEAKLSGKWVAGKEYTYNITINKEAVDLSMVDNAGNVRASMTTANCYLIHEAGIYKIPLVYGNAIKNGKDNRVAYYPGESGSITNGINQFVNHAGTGISGPWITKSTSGTGVNKGMGQTAASAELLWQDVAGLVTAVSISGDYLKFTVGNFSSGNALIAVKNASGAILWSWHIWATEDDLSNTTVVVTGSHNYTVAPVNLGWVPTGVSEKQGYCPYYQWGRKDPFIPCNGTTSGNTNKTIYNISGANITPASITASSTGIQFESTTSATIATNIQNPIKHYYNSSNYGPCNTTYYNMWDAQNTSTNNVTTATKKTIYDPCPPGFCVPTGNLWYYFGDGSTRAMSTFDTTNKGATWNIGITGDALWFPAVGVRGYSSGNLSLVGVGSSYSSASPAGSDGNRDLLFNYDSGRWSWNSAFKSAGLPVRPVVEE